MDNIFSSFFKRSTNIYFLLFFFSLIQSYNIMAQENVDWSEWQLYESVVDGNNKVIAKVEYQIKLTKDGNARAKWRVHNLSGLSATKLSINSKLYNLSDGRSRWTSGESKSRSKTLFKNGSIVTFYSDSVSSENHAKITKVTLEHPAFQGEFINNSGEKFELSSDDFGVMHRSILTCKTKDKKTKDIAISLERLGDSGFKVISEENNRSFTFLAKAYLENPTDTKVKAEYDKKFREHAAYLCDGKVGNGWLKKWTKKLYRVMMECTKKNGSISCNEFGKKSAAIGVRG
jgi:hypothetical protein